MRPSPEQADNGAVRIINRIVVLAALTLCVSWPGVREAVAGGQQKAPKAQVTPTQEERVDINHATIEDLMKVPGMKRTWAGRIVRFRPYRAKNDLVERGVVTGEVYERIKGYVIAHHEKH
ncbi:MAG: helix-hairpin-helix domain-containing protein [Terracidiphilus sp.]